MDDPYLHNPTSDFKSDNGCLLGVMNEISNIQNINAQNFLVKNPQVV